MCFSQIEQGSVPHETSVAVVVETDNERLIAQATRLQSILGATANPPSHELYFGQFGVELRLVSKTQIRYRVDFSNIDRGIRSGNLSKRQPLPKAIGRDTTTVIDATAGFGKDAARLALMGFQVIAIERSPIIAALLIDGAWRANQDIALNKAIGGRLTVVEADASSWLEKNPSSGAVFLDPMFPPKRKKSALPPGHIQLLQSIVGYDNIDETKKLFQSSLKFTANRVVVKRPNHAPHMSNNPVAIHQGKLVRYEVYRPIP